MQPHKPSLRRPVVSALAALGAAAVSIPLASPDDASPIGHESTAEVHLNIELASTEKFPGYPF